MSEDNASESARRPDFIAYNVQESKDRKGYWNKVGAAWRHRDGQGYDIHLDSLPVNGRVTLRELREERMRDYEQERRDYDQTPDRRPERPPARGREHSV